MVMESVVSQTEWGIGHISMYTKELIPGSANLGDPEFSFLFIDMSSARDPMYYITNIILPAIVISLLVLTVFFLPCESGEKVSLGITILLAFTVFQLVVSDTLPPNTKTTPLVGECCCKSKRYQTYSTILIPNFSGRPWRPIGFYGHRGLIAIAKRVNVVLQVQGDA
jgi:hypothetical protein